MPPAGAPPRNPQRKRLLKQRLVGGAVLTVLALTAIPAIAPPPPASAGAILSAYVKGHAQYLHVGASVEADSISRATYSATPAAETFSNHGTNFDWAALVLLSGKWPITSNNVTVLTRWMRQENGANNWWNRNNPLNNGYGSGGGGGTGHYANLIVAAQKAAENLHKNPGFAPIAADLAADASPDVTARAIWASPWSTSHYANGTHWSTRPVDSFTAPASAW